MAKLKIQKLANALGAEVSGVDMSKPISQEDLQQILAAWKEHLVLRFRGQELTDPQLLEISRNFGEIDPPGPNSYGKPFLADFPDINVISNIKVGDQPVGGLGDGEAVWHADMTYIEMPPKASFLHALEIPATGGNTEWGNMYLAYEALPTHLKQAIKGRKAIHDATYNSAGMIRKGMKDVTDPREAPGAHHPLVAKHPESGLPCLFLGRRRNSYILGMDLDASNQLLDELWAHIDNPEFTFTQVWQLHDLILWDNRCTLHRRDSFDPQSRRLMHRTQIKGSSVTPFE
ncbi:TauD/TfdA dioxygenase family protein [Polynucleobacter sinensis]|uniref:TauD/TfdA dioxygenase family protein n=1 Tax=Polynucleobacter sinensis TaxID=1743157 RepID=UPI00078065AE|nr:TauD/TfdA family dioxygenase [Polynucleobacter sinensis]